VTLHPALRLVLLLALGASLFSYSLTAQLVIFALLLLFIARRGGDALSGAIKALRRIRWLLISIAVIYLLVAPEPGVYRGFPWPTQDDFTLALRRAGVLVILVTAVEFLRQTTTPQQTASAITALLYPLQRLGLDVERLAVRTAMTLDSVPRTAELVARSAGEAGIKPRHLAGWAQAAAGLITEIESGRGPVAPAHELPRLGLPSVRDWLNLGVLLLLIVGLTRI
jgi:energy-coupling factor transporter transmembrane protein EcfT